MFPGLDGVDGLARHADPSAKLGLAPSPLGAQHSQAIVHVTPISRLVSGNADKLSASRDYVKMS